MKNTFEQPLVTDNQQEELVQELPNVSDVSESEFEKKKNFETIVLEIDGKNYEVIKTHFSYPEHIQKENGGVEGYDRFKFSWDDFDNKEELDKVREESKACCEGNKYNDYVKSVFEKEKELSDAFTLELNKISEELSIGTEMKEETISHYVGAVVNGRSGMAWNDNRFFINKPFDIKDYLDFCMTYIDVTWNIFKDGKRINVIDYIKQYSPEYAKQYEQYARFGESYLSSIKTVDGDGFELRDLDYLKLLEFLKDKDHVTSGMSFASGSHLSSKSGILGGETYRKYSGAFFNFNNRNSAFSQYIKNINEYKEALSDDDKELLIIKTSGDYNNHPMLSMVFTDKFPAFRWCFADTAYVPMKDGPNFFKFYSK